MLFRIALAGAIFAFAHRVDAFEAQPTADGTPFGSAPSVVRNANAVSPTPVDAERT